MIPGANTGQRFGGSQLVQCQCQQFFTQTVIERALNDSEDKKYDNNDKSKSTIVI